MGAPTALAYELQDVLNAVLDWKSIQETRQLLPVNPTNEDLLLAMDKMDASRAKVIEDAIEAGVPIAAIEAAISSVAVGFSAEDALTNALIIGKPEAYDEIIYAINALGAFVGSENQAVLIDSKPGLIGRQSDSEDSSRDSFKITPNENAYPGTSEEFQESLGRSVLDRYSHVPNLANPGSDQLQKLTRNVGKQVQSALSPEALGQLMNVIDYVIINNRLETLIKLEELGRNPNLEAYVKDRMSWHVDQILDPRLNKKLPNGMTPSDLEPWIRAVARVPKVRVALIFYYNECGQHGEVAIASLSLFCSSILSS